MRFFKSIRWRFQLWYGLLFTAMLFGFGFTAWEMEKASRFQDIDQELHQRISILTGELRPANPGPPGPADGRPRPDDGRGPGPNDGRGPPPPRLNAGRQEGNQAYPPDDPLGLGPNFGGEVGLLPNRRLMLRLTPTEQNLFNGSSKENYYYVVWLRNGPSISRSARAPEDVPEPETNEPTMRQRGPFREAFFFTAPGDCMLVGRPIESDLASLDRLGWLIAAVGVGVLVAGLAGGWWLTSHALRPIQDISAAATSIANGDLAKRINISQTGSELGQLAVVLNETFSRLDAAFQQQTRFTSDAAHELRTPVTVLLTQTQSALARTRSAEEYRETIEACQRAAQRMRRLTESLLELARLDSGHEPMRRASFDLSHTTEDCIDLVLPLAEQRGITLESDLPKTPCHGDPERLGQVITNLLANAIHYNRDGGQVRISLCTQEQDALLVVADSGKGISEHDMPHVFERFYRADKARTGTQERTGLGLAICKAIIEAHHGSIEVYSEMGRGSAFTVRLPSSAQPGNGSNGAHHS